MPTAQIVCMAYNEVSSASNPSQKKLDNTIYQIPECPITLLPGLYRKASLP